MKKLLFIAGFALAFVTGASTFSDAESLIIIRKSDGSSFDTLTPCLGGPGGVVEISEIA